MCVGCVGDDLHLSCFVILACGLLASLLASSVLEEE